jgi:NADPH:quinone reductase
VKAAYYERQGSAADVLVIGNLPDPEPSFGEVRVKVVFSGLNPTDIKTRTGFAGRPMPSRALCHTRTVPVSSTKWA